MKKARFSRAAYDNQQLQRKQLRCKIDIRYFSDASHSTVIKRGVIRAVIDERPAKSAEKKCFASARSRDRIPIYRSVAKRPVAYA